MTTERVFFMSSKAIDYSSTASLVEFFPGDDGTTLFANDVLRVSRRSSKRHVLDFIPRKLM